MSILAVGGAGYIGSHVVRECRRLGHDVVVFDNFSTGHPEAVSGAEIVTGDLHDGRTLKSVFQNYRIDAVMHFAASAVVPESVEKPAFYYHNNVAGTLNLVQAMLENGVERLVFSSTAAVYGTPQSVPIEEGHSCAPINPYGRSKLIAEELLAEIAASQPLQYVALRYFNAAGADLAGDLGEDRGSGESHLIPLILNTALGLQPKFTVFGTDYETEDGSCVRDFIHVTDIARAHLLALDRIDRVAGASINLGLSSGFSVFQVIREAEQVVGDLPIAVAHGPRRPGDPPVLVASNERAQELLGWQPQFSDLNTILESAWRWHRLHPHGFGQKAEATEESKRSELFGDIAVRLGFVDRNDVGKALDRQARESQTGHEHKLIGLHMLEMGLLSTSELIEILRVYDDE